MLTSWRSEIGKNGIGIVEDLWKSDLRKYSQKEQRKAHADANLDGLNYLYKFPGRLVSAIFFRLSSEGLITMLGRSSAEHFALDSYRSCFHPTSRRYYQR